MGEIERKYDYIEKVANSCMTSEQLENVGEWEQGVRSVMEREFKDRELINERSNRVWKILDRKNGNQEND